MKSHRLCSPMSLLRMLHSCPSPSLLEWHLIHFVRLSRHCLNRSHCHLHRIVTPLSKRLRRSRFGLCPPGLLLRLHLRHHRRHLNSAHRLSNSCHCLRHNYHLHSGLRPPVSRLARLAIKNWRHPPRYLHMFLPTTVWVNFHCLKMLLLSLLLLICLKHLSLTYQTEAHLFRLVV